jgi:hypothetical protein
VFKLFVSRPESVRFTICAANLEDGSASHLCIVVSLHHSVGLLGKIILDVLLNGLRILGWCIVVDGEDTD